MLQFTISARCPKTGAKLSSVNIFDCSLTEAIEQATTLFVRKMRTIRFTYQVDYAGSHRHTQRVPIINGIVHRAKELSIAA